MLIVQNKIINQIATQHWQDWFDIRIPALANKTPREAARTKEGRERLEALLLIYEQSADKRSKWGLESNGTANRLSYDHVTSLHMLIKRPLVE